jgi:hypothetical protein
MEEQMPCIFKYINELYKIQPNKMNIEFIKDNTLIGCNSRNYYLTKDHDEEIPEFDFILYTDASNNPFNVKVIHNNEKLDIQDSKTYQCEKSRIKFMLIEIIIGNKTYKIDLLTEKYNFYVKDNILDVKFFLYYLHYIHPDKVFYKESIIKSCNVVINIIDNNVIVKKIYLNEDINECVYFSENGYEIITKP